MKTKNYIFLLFSLAFSIMFIVLGIWQLQRLSWKESLIADYEAKKNLPIEILKSGASGDSEFKSYWKNRKVQVVGTAYPAQIFRITGKMQGRDKGNHIVMPVLLPDDNLVFVLQGWAPLGYNDEHSQPYEVNFTGMLTEYSGPQFSFLPNNMPEENFWLWPDIAAMSAKLNKELEGKNAFPLLLKVIDKEAKLPRPLSTEIEFRNDHLGYALTWFFVATSTIILSIIFYKKNK